MQQPDTAARDETTGGPETPAALPHHRRRALSPAGIWLISRKLHLAGHQRSAKVFKGLNFFLFKAVLPPEVDFQPDIQLGHQGLSTVIHPKTTIGHRVHIWHGVTFASENPVRRDVPGRIVVGDDVEIGAGAILVCKRGKSLYVGDGARIGAGSVVTSDVPAGVTVVGVPARPVGGGGGGRSQPG